jgi:arylmalonate decarboxylase
MKINRRNFLESVVSTAALSALGFAVQAAESQKAPQKAQSRKLGLIFPPAGRGVPEEGLAMYGDKIEYLIENLGLETMTPAGYEAVLERIGPCAERLAARGAEAVMLTGTSLTFFKGEAYNQELTRLIREASGLPVTTMSTAVIDGLKAVGATRIAAPTAYNTDVNDRLRSFLMEHGFEVLTVQGLGVEAVADINLVTQPDLLEFCVKVTQSAPEADAVLVSCGGLRTLEILAPLESRTARPAVTSMPHGLYYGAKLLGMDASVEGYGRLIAL